VAKNEQRHEGDVDEEDRLDQADRDEERRVEAGLQ
jgi:hypothetical protein